MSKFGEPQPCRNNCGAYIYFDKDSTVGHPSADKWLPLEYNHDSGIRTGLVHQCPNKPSAPKVQQSKDLATSSMQTMKQQSQEQEQASLAKVTDESVQRGITALKMFSDLAIQIEGIETDCNQTRVILEDLQRKMDRLLNLVNAEQQQQQKQVEK